MLIFHSVHRIPDQVDSQAADTAPFQRNMRVGGAALQGIERNAAVNEGEAHGLVRLVESAAVGIRRVVSLPGLRLVQRWPWHNVACREESVPVENGNRGACRLFAVELTANPQGEIDRGA